MDLPKVNILTAGTMVVAIVGTISGGIWYASSQASIIEGLSAEVSRLTIENNATDRTNLIRDVEHNTEQIEDLIDYIVELEEEGEEHLSDVMSEFDEVYETQEGFILQFNQIVKLQARVKTLENTLEFLARRPSLSDGR